MANSQELYLQALCVPVSFYTITAKIEVQYFKTVTSRYPSTDKISISKYFCKNEYDPKTASFTDIRNEFYVFYYNKNDNCPVCDIVQEESNKQIPIAGDIGQIVFFDFPRDTSLVEMSTSPSNCEYESWEYLQIAGQGTQESKYLFSTNHNGSQVLPFGPQVLGPQVQVLLDLELWISLIFGTYNGYEETWMDVISERNYSRGENDQ
ncbi:hypothetical protein BDP27DRAFT_1370758 [Rhodocollybia butyracea]|nr:hypothetical protein BDP27DRAFT_1370758 [Rhodocollybia butyracea]